VLNEDLGIELAEAKGRRTRRCTKPTGSIAIACWLCCGNKCSATPLRRTQQGDYFKRDYDRLRRTPLLSARRPSPGPIPDPGFFTAALAGIGLLRDQPVRAARGRWPAFGKVHYRHWSPNVWRRWRAINAWNPAAGTAD